MKNKLLLLFAFLLSCLVLKAQYAELSWYRTSFPVGYTTSNFGVCGSPSQVKFKAGYTHCPNGPFPCITGCGSNPFRYTVKLYRNGTLLSTQSFIASSYWSNSIFDNVTASPGNYYANIKFERRKGFLCTGWETIWSGNTNTIVVSDTPATPNFNVNGTTIPSDGSPIATCISNIQVNAAATSCETSYHLGVQECDRWWNRTYDYEWGVWFSGQAPNNINLQSMAATYSYPPYYTGSASRQGSILIGGNLPSGQARYYRVNVCTAEPSWQCKTALIQVNNNCFNDEGEEDLNQYIVWNQKEELVISDSENIIVTFEADFASEDSPESEFSTTFNSSEGNIAAEQFTIAPNPFSDYTTVNLKGFTSEEPVIFELFNTMGERVRLVTTRDLQFDIHRQTLPAGIYFYRISADNTPMSSGKIMIE